MTVGRIFPFPRLGRWQILALLFVLSAVTVASLWWRYRPYPEREYRVGVNPTSQYYKIYPDGHFEGLAFDVINEAARREGLKIRWVRMTLNIDPSLERDLIDIYPVMVPTSRRRATFHLTRPWLANHLILLSPEHSPVPSLAAAGAGPLAYRASISIDESLARVAPEIARLPKALISEAMQAVCRGEAGSMLIEPRFLDRLLLHRPPGCETTNWVGAELQNINTDVVIASNPASASAADRLARQIAGMTRDGTLTRMLHEWSPYTSAETYSQAAIRAALDESRFLRWGAFCSLLIALSLAFAFYQTLRAKREARKASAAKSEFLANMSHEIRTPMNAVVGMADLLLTMKLSSDAREYAQIIRQSSEALVLILNDILDFSKIEAGHLALESAPFDLRACLEDVVRLLAPRAREKHIELACDIAPDAPNWLAGDVNRLRQILLNLAGNAVKFTQKGEVILTVRRTASAGCLMIRFSVSDTGPGIPAARQKDLFQSFSQLDASTTRRFGGTGLGLAISKQLVQMMGGRIGLESRLGQGSTFWFDLPLRLAEAQPDPDTAAPGWEGLPALVVDDNATNRRILGASLSGWGFTVTEAASGDEAIAHIDQIQRLRQPPPEIVLLDYQMPGKNGVETARELARRLPASNLMLLSSVAANLEDLLEPGMANPFKVVLTKPVRNQFLKQTLAGVLSLSPLPPPHAPEAAPPVSKTHYDLHILIAEDNIVNQKVVVQLLRRLGFENVLVVADGRQAVDAIQKHSFDLVFLDLQMPEMDGIEAARVIRRQCASAQYRPRLVALTANALSGDREACLEAGMDDYLSKPLRIDDLRAALERALNPATPLIAETKG